ncbi:hypothetical protein F5B20DRAFT_297329 [Whalleya microplaca]|nr:hypothetical protein F5B20DRAFT_297329 [Whalleya microplaca]
MDFSFQSLVQHHSSQMDVAFQNIVRYILGHSELVISLIRISNVTEDSFHVSIEARATNTGPAKATLTPMTMDLCGPGGCFGQVTLPQIMTTSGGAPIKVTNQLVRITDASALQAFIRPVICATNATLSLKNGHTTVLSLGLGPKPITYEKEIPMAGMCGPTIRVQRATTTQKHPGAGAGAGALAVTIRVMNPSPMELSFGICGFEIQDAQGRVLADLKGRLDIRRGHFEATLQGNVDRKVAVAALGQAQMRLVGKRCAGAGWCDDTVKGIDVPLANMQKVFKALGITCEEEDDDEPEEELINEKQAEAKRESWWSTTKFWKA